MARRQEQYDPPDEMDNYSHSSIDSAPSNSVVHQAFDWGISGSILAIIVLTVLYTISPSDRLPGFVPDVDEVGDLAAILAGGSSVALLAAVRYRLRSRIGGWGCLIAIIVSSAGAFALFWVLMQVLDRLF